MCHLCPDIRDGMREPRGGHGIRIDVIFDVTVGINSWDRCCSRHRQHQVWQRVYKVIPKLNTIY